MGVAVIGYSFMGRAHSNAWRNVAAFYPDVAPVRMQTLVGRDGTRVEQAAADLGWAGVATDWREVIERDDIDIVDVCTPGHLHAEVALAALAAGKHVLVEKPLANSVAECEALVAAAAAARGRALLGFNYRRVPALALARELVGEGRIGTVQQARLSYLQDWLSDPQAPMTWRLRRESAGSGVLGDLGSHAVDQLHYLLGEHVTHASGTLRTFVPERPGPHGTETVTVDDAAWATLHTDSGVVASLEVSRVATGRKNALTVELFGTSGSLRFDLERLNELVLTQAGDARTSGPTTIMVTEPEHPYLKAWWPAGHVLGWDHTFTSQAADFLRAIAADEPVHATFEDGLAAQRVLEAIETSHAAGGLLTETGN
ncbi:Gfo/Idh/MocA family protein [Ornithinimicrobium cryptoxanthini]|uniref:Gfo/Idh/MocA family oxidoreductase n=1 Tax=Ornithinimicrobium cryptoxanthini TaxID=2934161 RepID=A0ABY4YMS5_9MICO|nr:Gfo/Idh/MocA family oxidoreductase [Ornithinimicrobium cryptoxanthini]USQ77984.1 Gfo/Idh/MocA family oxidoreductase [Ornithinimicrobium cryptoxanthini]